MWYIESSIVGERLFLWTKLLCFCCVCNVCSYHVCFYGLNCSAFVVFVMCVVIMYLYCDEKCKSLFVEHT